MRIAISCFTAGILAALWLNPAHAQSPTADVHVFQRELPPPPGEGATTFEFISTDFVRMGKIVKNAPYSADEVTETTQTLGDGNRIVRKSTAQFSRDSQGRTRNDRTLEMIGPWAAGGEAPQTTIIHDTVAGVNYILSPRERVARKTPFAAFGTAADVKHAAEMKHTEDRMFILDAKKAAAIAGAGGGIASGGITSGGITSGGIRYERKLNPPDRKTESLGKQVIEGVEAEGSRTTLTIPAGQIGNERPIETVDERWYSPELQTVMMTRHVDPRFGETVFRLTNVRRGDPSPSLFDVPPDYTIKEDKPDLHVFRKQAP